MWVLLPMMADRNHRGFVIEIDLHMIMMLQYVCKIHFNVNECFWANYVIIDMQTEILPWKI